MDSGALWQRRLLLVGASFYSACCAAMATCSFVPLATDVRGKVVAGFIIASALAITIAATHRGVR